MKFEKATKKMARLLLAVIGGSGTGKTMTALRIGSSLGKRIAVIDTERGSASKYAGRGTPYNFAFDVLQLETFHPRKYIEAIRIAQDVGYDVLIIDSLSHAWIGRDGALELVDRAAKRAQSGNSFAAWREVTPLHNEMVDAILQARMHVIVTMRAKTEYVIEENERGKKVPRKIGVAPVQRDGLEYEFDVVADLNQEHDFVVTKTRCPALAGKVFPCAGADVAAVLKDWLSDGEAATAPNPAHDGDSAEVDVATAIALAIGDAKTQEALQRVATQARAALAQGQIDADEYDELKPMYAARRAYLAGENGATASAPA